MFSKIGDIFNEIKKFNEFLGSAFSNYWKNNVQPFFSEFGNNIADFFSDVVNNISNFNKNVGLWFGGLFDNIKDFFSGIPEFFALFWDTLRDFFIGLIVPEDDYFSNLLDNFKMELNNKMPYDVYVDAFNNLKEITEGDVAGLDVNFSNYNVGATGWTISTPKKWIPFEFILKYQQKWFTWVRVFTWIFSLIYTINQVSKILKGSTISDGMNNYSGGNKYVT